MMLMKNLTRKLLPAVLLNIALISTASAGLQQKINAIISQKSQAKVNFAVKIIKADTSRVLYSHNARRPMIPASNIKSVVTAAALNYLDADYQYQTKIGLCNDTLVVIGSGDPLLGDKDTDIKYGRAAGWIFEDIISKLKKNGIAAIKDIVIDTGVFDDQRTCPDWPADQLNRDYACEVAGLNFNGNCIEISAEKSAGKINISLNPQTSFIEFTNKVKPISKGKSLIGAYRTPKPNKIIVFGKCKNNIGPFKVAIERPAAFFGYLLYEHLTKAGIKVTGQLYGKMIEPDCNFIQLVQYNTPLADCLKRANKDSFALAANALLKTIAANATGDKNGTWQKGCELIGKYLLQLGIDKSEFHIDDGCGLSKSNKLSANAITAVLLDMYRSKYWPLYKDSLAAGGLGGTIAKYFKDEKYKGKIFGKTGYIAGAKSFSGVCTTSQGDYLFSILANNANSQTRKAINDIAKVIVDYKSEL